jgi:hypothetical protein
VKLGRSLISETGLAARPGEGAPLRPSRRL